MLAIDIPGPFEPGRTFNVPPITVNIPIVTSGNFKRSLIFCLGWSLFSAFSLAQMMGIIETALTGARPPGLLRAAPGILLSAVAVVAGGLITIRYAQLVRRSKNVLTIDHSGVRDLRHRTFIAWGNVRHISGIHDKKGISGASIHLRNEHIPPLPPLRLGLKWLFLFDRKTLEISVTNLDERPYILVHAMGALVRHNGGTSDISQWGWKRRC